jgi:RecA/RadA recombinase
MALKKKEFSLETIKNKYSTSTKYKPEMYYNCGEAFMDACGLPGPAAGAINMFLGHTNSSKTTALILTAADAQKKGHLPVFIITERKWSWSHAVELGVNAYQKEDGSWDGDFLFNDSFDYIEQATDYINELLDMQEEGTLPYNLVFLFDSIGSVPCKMTFEGRGGKMANASVLADKIGMGVHSRITKSRKEDYPFYNTMVIVNQPWTDVDMTSPMSQPEIRAKGGEAIWLASSLVFLFGKQKKAGINHIDATKNGRKVSFAIRTRISILKNHITGLGYKDGKILAVHNGYISDTKEALDKYKKEYSDYWVQKLGGGDYNIEESNDDIFEE